MQPDANILTRQRFRFLVTVILFAGLFLRAGWALFQPTDDASLASLPDQGEYLSLAKNLLSGKGLFFLDNRFGDAVYAYRMPAYPAFVALCGGLPTVIRLAQAVLDTSTIAAIGLLAMALLTPGTKRTGALVAMATVALNPFLIYFTGLILSETLFTAMLAWGMLMLVVGERGGRLRGGDWLDPPDALTVGDAHQSRPLRGTLLWLGGGLLLAGSALVRPSAIPLAVLIGVFAPFAARTGIARTFTFRKRWPLPVATTMVVLTLAVLTPWAWRNSRMIGTWVWTTTNSGVTAYDGLNPDADGSSNQAVLSGLPQLRQMNEVERSEYLGQRATEWATNHPEAALKLAAIKAGRTWSPVPLSIEYGSWKYRAIGLLFSLPFDLLIVLGVVGGPISRAAKTFLLIPVVYFTLVHMASVGSLRYRVPLEPPMAVLAAAGLLALRGPRLAWKRAEEATGVDKRSSRMSIDV